MKKKESINGSISRSISVGKRTISLFRFFFLFCQNINNGNKNNKKTERKKEKKKVEWKSLTALTTDSLRSIFPLLHYVCDVCVFLCMLLFSGSFGWNSIVRTNHAITFHCVDFSSALRMNWTTTVTIKKSEREKDYLSGFSVLIVPVFHSLFRHEHLLLL